MLAIATVALIALPAAHAQSGAVPSRTSDTNATAPKTSGNTARRSIELSPAERQAIDDAAVRRVPQASIEQALQPASDRVERVSEEPATRIEQSRNANRVTEVTVTPANSSHSYVMINREHRPPLSVTQMGSGLSVPMFFRFEFGRGGPPPAPNTAAPLPPAPSR